MALLDKFKRKPKKEEKKETRKKQPKKIGNIKRAKNLDKAYNVIKRIHDTEKAVDLIKENKYVFRINRDTNKIEVARAITSLYGVKVKKVNIIHLPGKKRRLGRSQGWRQGLKKGYKKAIVTLRKGEKIEEIGK